MSSSVRQVSRARLKSRGCGSKKQDRRMGSCSLLCLAGSPHSRCIMRPVTAIISDTIVLFVVFKLSLEAPQRVRVGSVSVLRFLKLRG